MLNRSSKVFKEPEAIKRDLSKQNEKLSLLS